MKTGANPPARLGCSLSGRFLPNHFNFLFLTHPTRQTAARSAAVWSNCRIGK
jgi:hypothetical protein